VSALTSSLSLCGGGELLGKGDGGSGAARDGGGGRHAVAQAQRRAQGGGRRRRRRQAQSSASVVSSAEGQGDAQQADGGGTAHGGGEEQRALHRTQGRPHPSGTLPRLSPMFCSPCNAPRASHSLFCLLRGCTPVSAASPVIPGCPEPSLGRVTTLHLPLYQLALVAHRESHYVHVELIETRGEGRRFALGYCSIITRSSPACPQTT